MKSKKQPAKSAGHSKFRAEFFQDCKLGRETNPDRRPDTWRWRHSPAIHFGSADISCSMDVELEAAETASDEANKNADRDKNYREHEREDDAAGGFGSQKQTEQHAARDARRAAAKKADALRPAIVASVRQRCGEQCEQRRRQQRGEEQQRRNFRRAGGETSRLSAWPHTGQLAMAKFSGNSFWQCGQFINLFTDVSSNENSWQANCAFQNSFHAFSFNPACARHVN